MLAAAEGVRAGLRAGSPRLWETPQGPRPALPLLWQGRAVAVVYLLPDGAFAPRTRGPQLAGFSLPAGGGMPGRVAGQVAALRVSGAVERRGPHYEVPLLLSGQVVGRLRLGGAPLRPMPEPERSRP